MMYNVIMILDTYLKLLIVVPHDIVTLIMIQTIVIGF